MCEGRNKVPGTKTSPFKKIQNERGKVFFPLTFNTQCSNKYQQMVIADYRVQAGRK